MINFIKDMFKFDMVDEQKTKSFYEKLYKTINRAEKARTSILHSNLPEKDRLQIADEILYLIDALNEFSKIKRMEV